MAKAGRCCHVSGRDRRGMLGMTTGFRGQSVRRLEDERFLTGHGRFIEDIDAAGQAWMQVVRSPHAHAEITGIDIAAAAAMPGVLGVFTAADLGLPTWLVERDLRGFGRSS